tara:strand:+ start:1120 stop:1410 length:291 start_codon:yes stop_codon:yes gene_type:complete
MEKQVPDKIRIKVTKHDTKRAESDPSKSPLVRAISRALKTSIDDVEVNREKVYIWNEWDSPEYIFSLDDKAKSFNASWELKEDYPETLEFNITRRK